MIASRVARADKKGEVERVYRLIKTRILKGVDRPGQFLAEVALARVCGTSRTPVREACNRLAQEGWMTHIRHKGYLLPPISTREILDLYEYRKLLEGFTAEKAALDARPAQLAALKNASRAERDPRANVEGLLAANHAVHRGLAEIAGNRRVSDELRRVLEWVDRLDVLSLEHDDRPVPHDDILRAVEARDPAAARRAMAAHVDAARDRMLKVFGT